MTFYGRIFLSLIWINLWIFPSFADDRFTVQNVQVDVKEASAIQARTKAITQGQREAFNVLMERILLPEERASFPEISDAQLDTFLQDFEVQNEKNSAVRYMGTLTFRFSPSKVQEFLAQRGNKPLPCAEKTAIVIIPVYEEPQATRLWEEENAWRDAWNNCPDLDPRYIIPLGDLNDISDLSSLSALKGNKQNIVRLMGRYHAEQALVAVLRHDFPFVLSVYVYNQEGLSHVAEDIPLLEEGSLTPALAHKAIKKTLEIEKDFKMENNSSFAAMRPLECRIPFRHHKEWLQIQDKLLKLRSVRGVDVISLSRRQAVVLLDYVGQEKGIEKALKTEDFEISPDPKAPKRKLIQWRQASSRRADFPVSAAILSPFSSPEEGMK